MCRHRGDYCSNDTANLQISKEKEHSECYGFAPVYLHIKTLSQKKKKTKDHTLDIIIWYEFISYTVFELQKIYPLHVANGNLYKITLLLYGNLYIFQMQTKWNVGLTCVFFQSWLKVAQVKNKLSFQISIFLQVRNHNISQIWWRITEPNLLVQYYLQNYGVIRHGDAIRLVNIIIPLGSKKISWSIGIYIDIFNWNTHTCIYIDMITTNSSKNHVKENMKNLSQKRILSQTPRWERERRFWNSPYLLYFSK